MSRTGARSAGGEGVGGSSTHVLLWMRLRLPFFSCVLLPLTAAGATPPVPPPPDPERLALAAEIWSSSPIGPALAARAGEWRVISSVVASVSEHDSFVARYLGEKLRAVLTEHIEEIASAARPCLADSLARSLSEHDLKQTASFVNTEAGHAYWQWQLRTGDWWIGCLEGPFQQKVEPILDSLVAQARKAQALAANVNGS